jgi:hypothetical protein
MSHKRTIARDSVFRGTGASEQPAVKQGLPTPEKPTRQTAVWLADDEVAWLDDRLQDIRRGGWRNATRSALIRALIRAAMEQDPDLRGVSGEQELSQRLTPTR